MKNLVLVLMLATLVGACAKKDQDLEAAAEKMAQEARQKVDDAMGDDPPQNIEDALKRVGDALADGDQSVAASDLKGLLPEKLGSLKRVSYNAERAGLGIKVSKANAEYGEDEKRLSLMITDLGGASGLAKMGRAMFETEIDREDENGFEKTTTYKGHKSFQRLQRSGDQSIGEMMVFVDDRFTVQLDGQNVPYKDMIKAMDQIDLAALTALAAAKNKTKE